MPVALAVLMTILVVIWGNAVVLLGRLLEASAAVTLVACPALALSVTLLLVRRDGGPERSGFGSPEPQPDSRPPRALLAVLAVTVGVASAGVLALQGDRRPRTAALRHLEPSKRLDVIRLLVGTAGGGATSPQRPARRLVVVVRSPTSATAASCAGFGAWHLVGAFHGGAFHPLELPFLGTLVFLWARLRYQSVAAPIVLHVVTNLPGVVFAR